MQRIVVGITSLEQHRLTLSTNPEIYRPACCPRCGVGTLWAHGSYDRKADRIGTGAQNANPVLIPRYCCSACASTDGIGDCSDKHKREEKAHGCCR